MKKVKTTIYADYNKFDIALLESFRSPSSHESMFKGIPMILYRKVTRLLPMKDRRETERSILQQSGIRLSEVERLREEGVVLDVVLDDFFVGVRCSLERVWLFTDWSRETLLRF